MDLGGCDSSGVWNINSDILLEDVVFQFITGITFNWDQVLWRIIALVLWIYTWTKLRIHKLPPYPSIQYCQSFGYIWQSFMLSSMLWYKNDLKLSHRKQVNAPSNMKLATYWMIFIVRHVGYLKVFHTIKNMKPFLLLPLQRLQSWQT